MAQRLKHLPAMLKQQWQNTKTLGQSKQADKNQTIHSIFKLEIKKIQRQENNHLFYISYQFMPTLCIQLIQDIKILGTDIL